MAITVQRPISVKVVMTEQFRTQLLNEARDTLKRIDENLKVVDAESKKYITTMDLQNPQQASALQGQYEAEKERLLRMKGELEWRVKEVEGIGEGVELPFRVFEGPVEVKEGDNLLERVTKAEIVIKDWQVVEIRGK